MITRSAVHPMSVTADKLEALDANRCLDRGPIEVVVDVLGRIPLPEAEDEPIPLGHRPGQLTIGDPAGEVDERPGSSTVLFEGGTPTSSTAGPASTTRAAVTATSLPPRLLPGSS